MDSIIDWLIAFASDRDHPLGLAAMFGSAAIEYVFPPFPGDTISLLGAILIIVIAVDELMQDQVPLRVIAQVGITKELFEVPAVVVDVGGHPDFALVG